ncbi:hypothetical protein ABT104_18235 [Streptomyces mobaraensis]|uniref:hypothetical protein n=1 Tax=Streptomyces mobaraensis TaxID=35621 RepID=UPI00332ADEBE
MTRAAAAAADRVAADLDFGGPAIPAQAGSHRTGPGHAGPAPAVGIPAAHVRPGVAPDPVRALLLRHHAVCADAVDPWELAARLEARGVTDRAAAACGHQDVFSLAEELHARVGATAGVVGADGVPVAAAVRAGGDGRWRPDEVEWPQFRTRDWGRYGTPGASGAEGAPAPGGGADLGSRAAGRPSRAAGFLGVSRDVYAAVEVTRAQGGSEGPEVPGVSRPFKAPGPPPGPSGHSEAPADAPAARRIARDPYAPPAPDAYGLCPARPGRARRTVVGALSWAWLLAYGCVGDRLLAALLHGHGRTGPRALAFAAAPTALGLACAVAPAAWCAHAFAGYARRRLADSRSLTAFRVRARCALPAILAVVLGALFLSVWTARSALPGLGHPTSVPALAAVALGFLLFLDRLCAAHGLARPAAAAVLAACAAEALPPVLLLAARLPGCAALGWPVTRLPGALGPSAPGLVACAGAALVLTVRAFAVLPHAAVHGLGGPDAAGTAGVPGSAGVPGTAVAAGPAHPPPSRSGCTGRSSGDVGQSFGCSDLSPGRPGSPFGGPGQPSGDLGRPAGHLGSSSDCLGPSSGDLGPSSSRPGSSSDRLGRPSGDPGPSSGRPDPSPGRLPGPSLRPGGAGPSVHPRQRSTHHDR